MQPAGRLPFRRAVTVVGRLAGAWLPDWRGPGIPRGTSLIRTRVVVFGRAMVFDRGPSA